MCGVQLFGMSEQAHMYKDRENIIIVKLQYRNSGNLNVYFFYVFVHLIGIPGH